MMMMMDILYVGCYYLLLLGSFYFLFRQNCLEIETVIRELESSNRRRHRFFSFFQDCWRQSIRLIEFEQIERREREANKRGEATKNFDLTTSV